MQRTLATAASTPHGSMREAAAACTVSVSASSTVRRHEAAIEKSGWTVWTREDGATDWGGRRCPRPQRLEVLLSPVS